MRKEIRSHIKGLSTDELIDLDGDLQLQLRNERGDCLVPARRVLDYFSGGPQAPPLAPTEADLRRAWYKTEQAKARRQAKEQVPLSAKELTHRICERVIGLEREVRMLSCRMAIHLRRAALIRDNKDPGIGKECLLFVGPSGAGQDIPGGERRTGFRNSVRLRL